MTVVQNSPQYKNLTTSNNGKNVRASQQAISHFFLEDNLYTQAESNSFGFLSDTEFSTTAIVSFSGTKKIYAICQGQIFVQPQNGNDDKVNVILKPFKQPINELPIKYFIYRGLDKNDFFTSIVHEGINRLKIAGDENSGTEFVRHIWKEFNKFYSSNPGNQPVFLEEFIGFPSPTNNQQLEDLIDEYFFKIAQYDDNTDEEAPHFAYELPLIPKGMQIGNATGSIGIDVVLNKGDYYIENDPFQFDLSFSRSTHHKLKTEITNSEFLNKLIKEKCTQFIDIAAFYGLHANGIGKLYVGESTVPLTTKEDVSLQIENFYTKNIVYLYIQGGRLRSYNFYGNYVISDTNNNNLQIGNSESTLSETTFETHGWPLHKINHTGDALALALITDNSKNASAYILTGFLLSEHEDNFIRNENLLAPQSEGETMEIINYTLPVLFSLPAISSDTLSSLIQIIYEGSELIVKKDVNDESFLLKDIDDVFGLLDVKILTSTRSELELPIVTENQLQMINFPNSVKTEDIGVVKTRRIYDVIDVDGQQFLQRVTYETLLDSIRQESIENLENTSANIDSISTSTVNYQPEVTNNFYQPELPYYLSVTSFTDENLPVKGIIISTNDLSKPSKKIVGISKTENDYLLDLITQENLNNSKIFLQNTLPEEEDMYLSPENISYKKYSILLSAENQDGELRLYTPSQEIFVYTMDGFVFNSTSYSENMGSLEIVPSINYEIPEK